MSNFNFKKYDCIGFDLDNTLVEYHIERMSSLIYSLLSKYLVDNKGYTSRLLEESFESGIAFVQRGLSMDFKRGNIVKLNHEGVVVAASHGTQMLNEDSLIKEYGLDLVWDDGKTYTRSMLEQWNSDMSEKIRCSLDYFDAACPLLFARVVDLLDTMSDDHNYSHVWLDILDGLNYLFNREGFASNSGEYFPAMKRAPEEYIKKCPEGLVSLLESLKNEDGKILFLITGSALDFANFTASFALGPNWMELFDIVVCFARKPNFFIGNRPFLTMEGLASEGDVCRLNEKSKVVSQGNWSELKLFLAKKARIPDPKIIYIGDNVVQDILAPVQSGCCEALCVCEELLEDDTPITGESKVWGSYCRDSQGGLTVWMHIMEKYATASIPSLSTLSFTKKVGIHAQEDSQSGNKEK